MSKENVERIRLMYEHFNRTDEPHWELFDSEAEFDATAVVGLGRYAITEGREEILGLLRSYAAAFEEWRIEPEEIIDAGDRVVAAVRDGGHLRGTDDVVYNRFTHVWTFRSGKIVPWKPFTDRSQALEAA